MNKIYKYITYNETMNLIIVYEAQNIFYNMQTFHK